MVCSRVRERSSCSQDKAPLPAFACLCGNWCLRQSEAQNTGSDQGEGRESEQQDVVLGMSFGQSRTELVGVLLSEPDESGPEPHRIGTEETKWPVLICFT